MAATQMISSDRNRAIVGMGLSGASVAKHYASKGHRFRMFDTRKEPPGKELFRAEFPSVDIQLGPLTSDSFLGCDELVISPGLDPNTGIFPELRKRGVDLIGDIELFAREAKAPVIAITGSNAKSTVTTLVGSIVQASGLNVGVGGNLGTPALDLLDDSRDLYVLELSSFQLETTYSLKPEVACILNLSQDHMDRYPNMLAYHQAKQRIYLGAKKVVCNRDDDLTMPLLEEGQEQITFGRGRPDLEDFGFIESSSEIWLAKGFEKLIEASDLGIQGRHNHLNALAALAICSAIDLPNEPVLEGLQNFKGLEHRCQAVAQISGISWINDSKATNAGAAIAAIEGFSNRTSDHRSVLLIAGGLAKGQDFDELAESIHRHVRQLILIGEDAKQIAQSVQQIDADRTPIAFAVNMEAAVQAAANAAVDGDTVLMSPACASFDMFSDYQERGKAFMDAVRVLQ